MRLIKHWDLFRQLVLRDFVSRYKGSFLGLAWTFVTPIMMLLVYTFVFRFVFNARWPEFGEGDTSLEFTAALFAGLIIHTMFGDVIGRAATIICENANFVKKVVFPLYLLPMVLLASAGFHFLIGVTLLLSYCIAIGIELTWAILLLPMVVIPYIILLSGVALFLAAAGVFVRDIHQVVGTLTTLMLFLSPIFYSVSSLPVWAQSLIYLNPISYPVECVRQVVLFGQIPELQSLLTYSMVAIVVGALGWIFFERTKNGFADVM